MSTQDSSRMKVGFVLVALVGAIGFAVCSQSPNAASTFDARSAGIVKAQNLTEHAPIAFVPWDAAGEISRMDAPPQVAATAVAASDELPKGVDPVQLRATIERMSKMYAGRNESAEIRTMGKIEQSYAAIRE